MTLLPQLFRPVPLARVLNARRAGAGRVTGRRELAARALLCGAQVLLVCGYACLVALVCSAVLGSMP
jgi:hypothetical protein